MTTILKVIISEKLEITSKSKLEIHGEPEEKLREHRGRERREISLKGSNFLDDGVGVSAI